MTELIAASIGIVIFAAMLIVCAYFITKSMDEEKKNKELENDNDNLKLLNESMKNGINTAVKESYALKERLKEKEAESATSLKRKDTAILKMADERAVQDEALNAKDKQISQLNEENSKIKSDFAAISYSNKMLLKGAADARTAHQNEIQEHRNEILALNRKISNLKKELKEAHSMNAKNDAIFAIIRDALSESEEEPEEAMPVN